MAETANRHVIAIVGGAVSASEAASVFAERGAEVVVFEQNPRPYGKIEDGLPRWHDKQRLKEYDRIASRLEHPNIHFVPLTRVGEDLPFEALIRDWGFTAIMLGNGAWRDRPLQVEGVDEYVGKGLIYQNPLIYWFNHYPEAAYDGPRYDIVDGAMVIGGGLASIDVVKVVMLELVARRLRERGHSADIVEMEHRGIPRTLEDLGLRFGDLDIEGCTLYYRRRALDMPVAAYKPGATPEQRKKTEQVREKLLDAAMKKYLFKWRPTHLPVGMIVEEDRLAGLRFIRTEIRDRKVCKLPGTEVDIRAPLIISSIGSVPAPMKGVPMDGEFFDFDWDNADGEFVSLRGYPRVFGLGNVVTGKGNIAVSRKHGAMVAEEVIARYLGVGDGALNEPDGVLTVAEERGRRQAEGIADRVQSWPPLASGEREALMRRVRERQEAVGYGGDLREWLAKVTPPDMP